MTEPHVQISSRGIQRLAAGHPWIYRSDVRKASAQPGDIVRVTDQRGRFLGRAFYSDRSQITLRLLSREDVPVDRAFFLERIRAAADHRQRVVQDSEVYRLVYGEGDRIPSLVVDRYGDYLVLQTLSQGTERWKAELVAILKELFSPAGILERNDPKVRLLEGLDQKVALLDGQVPEQVMAAENGLRFYFDLWRGQKTGGFLDQRENRRAAAAYARGEVLDCFSYTGAFALTLARHCECVEGVELSAAATEAARRNQELNHITNASFRTANVFDLLREYDEAARQFDMIVLDPPAFAKNRTAVPTALRGYKEINLRAMRTIRPGGYLVTCSCSHHIAEYQFLEMLAEAALDTRREIRVVERRTQSKDHPIVLSVPETMYIKCLILQLL